MPEDKRKSKEDWKRLLSPERYHVCFEGGTERAFTGRYHDCKDEGIYACACCGEPLFSSAAKYDSGTGWPSFLEPLTQDAVASRADLSHGMVRTEVLCAACDAHLGHVFEDGPAPTGQRYCMNSLALRLEPAETRSGPGSED